MKVLISGAGIAGCCLAWWLHRLGYEVTIVELAEKPRTGGYIIDFWGLGYDVAEHMELIDDLRRHDLAIEEMRIVDQWGRRIAGIDQSSLRSLTKGRMMSLPRSALASSLLERVDDRAWIRFGDRIRQIDQDDDGVDVKFHYGETARYDLVFGADGQHSAVRSLAFGEEARFERFLGYYAAAFTASGYPHRDPNAYVLYGEPGKEMARITLNDDASVFLLLFSEACLQGASRGGTISPQEDLRRIFSNGGWESGDILHALATAEDLYFDRMSQIAMPTWSAGRVVLLGDACAAPSLLAGEGASLAMAEAYILAQELGRCRGNYRTAFSTYEGRLQAFARRKQVAARGFAASFIPKTRLGLWTRNAALNLVGSLGLSRLLFRSQLRDPLQLDFQ